MSANERKAGMQISYKPDNEDWVNEQYIGTSYTDTEWGKDSNWESVAKSYEVNISSNTAFNSLFLEFKVKGDVQINDIIKISSTIGSQAYYITAKKNDDTGIQISTSKDSIVNGGFFNWNFDTFQITGYLLPGLADVSFADVLLNLKNCLYNDIFQLSDTVRKIYQYNKKDVTISDWDLNTRYVLTDDNKVSKKYGQTSFASLLLPIAKGYSIDSFSFAYASLTDANNLICIVDEDLNVLERNTFVAHNDNSKYWCISKFIGSANINNPEVYKFIIGYKVDIISDYNVCYNLLDKIGYQLDNETGAEIAQAGSTTCANTDFTEIEDGDTFFLVKNNAANNLGQIYAYDEEKNFVELIKTTGLKNQNGVIIFDTTPYDPKIKYYRFASSNLNYAKIYRANKFNVDIVAKALGIKLNDVLDDYFNITLKDATAKDRYNNSINSGDVIRKHQFPITIIVNSGHGGTMNGPGAVIKPVYLTYNIGTNEVIENKSFFVRQDVEVSFQDDNSDDNWYNFGSQNWFCRKQGRRASTIDAFAPNLSGLHYAHIDKASTYVIYSLTFIDKRKELYNTPLWWLPTNGKMIKFGDSITADIYSYAGMVGQILGWEVQNAAIVGYTIAGVWQSLKNNISGNYDLATFSGGTNGGYLNPLDQPQNSGKKYSEIIRQRDDNTVIGILNSYIDKVRAGNPQCPVVIINPWEAICNYLTDDTENSNSRGTEWYRNKIDMQNVAVERGCLFYDTQEHIPLCPEMFTMAVDKGLHPSGSTSQLWGIEFYLWLAKMLNH